MPTDRRRAQRGLALAQALARWTDAERAYRSAAARRLRVGASDFDALLLLMRDEQPWTAGKIAEALEVTTGAVTGLVDRLEKGGWVQRVRDAVDRRQVWIERAPARRQELDDELATQRAVLAAAASSVDDAALDAAARVIERAADHLLEQGEAASATEAAPPEAQEGALTSAPVGDATRGRLRIVGGVANLDIRAGRIKDLFRATFHERAPMVRIDGGNVQVKYRGFGLFGWSGGDSEITLTSALPWAIDIRGGVSEMKASLVDLQLERLEIVEGASEVDIRLPAPRGTVPVRVAGGASEVTFRRPAKAAVQLVVRGGASELRLDRKSLEAGDGVVRLATDGYESATDRYSIEITGGASEVAVVSD
jgi:DNA-binding MarR family transcriptional regulator